MRLPTKAIGTVKAAQYNELVDIVTALVRGGAGAIRVGPGLQMKQGATDTVVSVDPKLVGDTSFWARLTGAAADGDRWVYSWVEVWKDGDGYGSWDDKEGGRSGSSNAYNGDEYATDDYDAVPTNTIVRMRKVAASPTMTADEYWFCSNEDTGEGGTSGFWAIITDSDPATDTDRWTYDWQEAEQTGTGYPMTAKAGGATGTAYNGAENPDLAFRSRPVPDDSIVWIQENEDGEYWFCESMNQDTNPDATGVTCTFNFDSTAQTGEEWDITEDKGDGVTVPCLSAIWWDDEEGGFYGRTHNLIFDDGGRLIEVTEPGSPVAIVVGVECYETP